MLNTKTAEGEQKSALPRLSYSMREAAQIIGVSYITMHRLLKRGYIKSSSALRTKVIPHSELERFLKVTMA
jgi:predicted site-specific integrase-resolvase